MTPILTSIARFGGRLTSKVTPVFCGRILNKLLGFFLRPLPAIILRSEMRPNLGHKSIPVRNAVPLDLNSGACGDGLKGIPLSQGLFSVAEDSKQDICVYKCRKPGWRVQFALPGFPAFKGHIPLTPCVALCARNTALFERRRYPPTTRTDRRGLRSV